MIKKTVQKHDNSKTFPYQSVVKQISPKDFPESSRKVQARIVNGDQAVSNQFPYQVAIRSISDRTVSICGGSILSNEYILTAAHCTKGYKSFEIGFGSNVLQSPLFRVVSQSKIEHPGFDSRTLTHVRQLKDLCFFVAFHILFSGHFSHKTSRKDSLQPQHFSYFTSEKVAIQINLSRRKCDSFWIRQRK